MTSPIFLFVFLASTLSLAPVVPNQLVSAQVATQRQVIRTSSPSEIISRFNRNNQLYIQGNPVDQATIDRLLAVLQKHPNVFVVLISSSNNVKQDDLILSRGISKSPDFQKVRNSVTKEKEGVLLMLYFNTPKGRMIFILTEELPDRLGVGDKNPELLRIFRSSIDQGLGLPGAIEALCNKINSTIKQRTADRDQLPPDNIQLVDVREIIKTDLSSGTNTKKNRQNQDMLLWLLGGGGVIWVIFHLFLIQNTSKQRAKAQGLFPEIEELLRKKTEELLELMQTADYTAIAGYTGETGEVVQKAVTDLNDCLVLLGGAKKVLETAKEIIARKDIISLIYPFAASRAVKLLTDRNTKLSFAQTDAMGTIATANPAWQEQFRQQQQKEIMLSYPDIVAELEKKQKKSYAVLSDVIKKDAEVAGFLEQVVQEAGRILPIVQSWQQLPITEFNGRQLLHTLIPNIIGAQGVIAKAREIMTKDPISAWDNYGKTGERLVQEARSIVTISEEAQSQLLPQATHTETNLTDKGIKTEWIRTIRKELSDRLDNLATNALHHSSSQGLEELRQDITTFQTQMQTAINQDEQRRVVIPSKITAMETTIEQTKQQIVSVYQSQGISISISQVLRESENDPNDRVTTAQQILQEIKSSLDRGDVMQAGQQVIKIDHLLTEGKTICEDSLSFLRNYKEELNKVKNSTKATADKISLNYQPIADRLVKTYHPDALSQVATELNCPPTVANILHRVNDNLKGVMELIDQANEAYQTAKLLSSRDQLMEGTKLLQETDRLLIALPKAEQILQQKQREAREQITRITTEAGRVLARKKEFYARDRAKKLCTQIEIQFRDINNLITLSPQNPYRVEDLIFQIKQSKEEARRELDNDQEAQQRAERELEKAQRELEAARSACESAYSTRFTYARVDFDRRNLDQEEFALREIRNYYDRKDFETASERASSLTLSITQIAEAARRAIEIARREDELERERRESYSRDSDSDSYSSGYSSSWSDSDSSGDTWNDRDSYSSDDSGSSGDTW